jgi:RNA polymerase sigma-70 factor (ECF subfamily)
MGICRRYVSDRLQASESLNYGFQKVFKHLEKFETEERLKAWIGRIMINTSIDTIRARSGQHRVLNVEDLEIGREPNIEIEINYQELLVIVRRLPKELRQIFILWAIEGYTHKEIAGLLGKPDGTCKFHLFQARKLLRKMLLSSGYETNLSMAN